MAQLLGTSDRSVRERTAAALAPGLNDAQRLSKLEGLPGYSGGGPVTSVLFTAWDPFEYGVYDRRCQDAKAAFVR